MELFKKLKKKIATIFYIQKKPSRSYAPVQTHLLIKADRINSRIYALGEIVKNEHRKKSITKEEFTEVIKSIQTIVYQELNTKGKEEWRNGNNRTTTCRS